MMRGWMEFLWQGGVLLPFKVSLFHGHIWKRSSLRAWASSDLWFSLLLQAKQSDYYGISGLENHKTDPALLPLPIWISAQLFSECKSLSLNPVCASHFSLYPVSSHCALLWWECLHLLGNLTGTEDLLLDAPGAVLYSGWTCLGPSASPQRAGAQTLTNLAVLCWTHVLGDPTSVHSIPNTI